ncbi:hypothetical protein EKL30_13550 [Candidimonas sp. SYP-B2681]|uniref:PsiF family protein n=1 Tax=Candidimonas sp. SYP-B2681 TaxID=2497686 RepID=UPI000F891E75|nr:PsiF family protein [Candidimonas sp. SYP-B2681]RTZ41589.1 hypothetical protein EKL30_13550 [Candidimonas sp. SYP-B2681]
MTLFTRLLLTAALLGGWAAGPAYSASAAAPQAAESTSGASNAKTPQQERMVTCNQNAKGKSGEERKAFMSSCLKGEVTTSKELSASQLRMKNCNTEATTKALKGDARQSFMSICLKAK